MLKNLLLLGLLSWVCFAYAEAPKIKKATADYDSYKVESPVEEQEAQRSVAGSKIKKKKQRAAGDGAEVEATSEPDSEVRYWQYSE